MSHLIGRRGYGRETYPTSVGAGAAAASAPLVRQRFIDGDTSQTGLNGSVAGPYKTIAQFMAARPDASAADADANYVGWLMPAIAGYTANVAFPPEVSTELRADSLSLGVRGALINGNVTWANLGAATPGTSPTMTIHNITVNGSAPLTITDDAGTPPSQFIFSADEAGLAGAALIGGIECDTTLNLGSVTIHNAAVFGDIDAGTAGTNASLNLSGAGILGTSISANGIICRDSSITVTAIDSGATCQFYNTQFGAAAPVLTSAGTALFDGPSWKSFLEAGGTAAGATRVLVVGGYSGAAVEGAALPTSGTTVVSIDGVGAVTVGYEKGGNHYSANGITGAETVQIINSGAERLGDTILITKGSEAVASTLTVRNNANAVIGGVIPATGPGFILARFDGADWVFEAGGYIPV